MVALKVPIAALFYIVHWAIKQSDEDAATGTGDGGVKPPHRPRAPRHPRRRGPHGSSGAARSAPRIRPPVVELRARAQHHP
jgi:hypothetical protein